MHWLVEYCRGPQYPRCRRAWTILDQGVHQSSRRHFLSLKNERGSYSAPSIAPYQPTQLILTQYRLLLYRHQPHPRDIDDKIRHAGVQTNARYDLGATKRGGRRSGVRVIPFLQQRLTSSYYVSFGAICRFCIRA